VRESKRGCNRGMLTQRNLQELDLEDRPLPWMREASVEEVLAASKAEEDAKKEYQKKKEQVLHEKRGFSSEGAEYDAYT
jgi:hypothetical protein